MLFMSPGGRNSGNTVSLIGLASELQGSASLFHILPSLGLQITSVSPYTKLSHEGDGVRTQALLFVRRVLYWLSHLPGPRKFFM